MPPFEVSARAQYLVVTALIINDTTIIDLFLFLSLLARVNKKSITCCYLSVTVVRTWTTGPWPTTTDHYYVLPLRCYFDFAPTRTIPLSLPVRCSDISPRRAPTLSKAISPPPTITVPLRPWPVRRRYITASPPPIHCCVHARLRVAISLHCCPSAAIIPRPNRAAAVAYRLSTALHVTIELVGRQFYWNGDRRRNYKNGVSNEITVYRFYILWPYIYNNKYRKRYNIFLIKIQIFLYIVKSNYLRALLKSPLTSRGGCTHTRMCGQNSNSNAYVTFYC
jgi:hypothetical protein